MEYGIQSLFPVVVAIGLAIYLRNAMVALFVATFLGGLIVNKWNLITGIEYSIDQLLFKNLIDPWHQRILIFVVLMGGLVGLITQSGATRSFVYSLQKFVTTPKIAQVLAWASGVMIFFGDFASCLIVGSSMKPLFDRFKISREKLAYIVDSTGAPVATISMISTWAVYQTGVIKEALTHTTLNIDAYEFYLRSIPFNFYPLFTLLFVLSLILIGRDFGPMAKAEATQSDDLKKEENTDSIAFGLCGFLLPLLVFIFSTLAMIYFGGRALAPTGSDFLAIVAHSNSSKALMCSSLFAVICAYSYGVVFSKQKIAEIQHSFIEGAKSTLEACLILSCAWSLSSAMSKLDAAGFLVAALNDSIPLSLMPTVVFVLSGIIAFATGSSFATMGIVLPIVIPLTRHMTVDLDLIIASSACVLSGAVFGDHCSPLSDTTVLSSLSSKCDLLSHVKTQAPYALTVALISILFGTIPMGFGVPLLNCLISGSIFIIFWHLINRNFLIKREFKQAA